MGIAYFYTGDADRALKEFDEALKVDPGHAQTLFNVGIVKMNGKNDPKGRNRRMGVAAEDRSRLPGPRKGGEPASPGESESEIAPVCLCVRKLPISGSFFVGWNGFAKRVSRSFPLTLRILATGLRKLLQICREGVLALVSSPAAYPRAKHLCHRPGQRWRATSCTVPGKRK